ncbi:MAG: hypothetical protein JXR94_03705 [Candidatus Hydrogenedentes bacterium]|nr:hypothetical protein [Candidatus Hydrogenedentota bacterium]
MAQHDRRQFSFTDPRQAVIHGRLGKVVGAGPAAFYRDACIVQEGLCPVESASHLVGHLFREIESALRAVLGEIAKMPENSEDKHREQILSILAALKIDLSEPVAQLWLKLADRNWEYTLHRAAHRDNLDTPRRVTPETTRFWRDFDGVLDVVLERFEGRFLDTFTIFDELIAIDSPSGRDAKRFVQRCPTTIVAHTYFYRRLKGLGWLSVLDKEGCFARPPEREGGPEGKGYRDAPWPEGDYLKRMASEAPSDVRDIFIKIAPSENAYVRCAMVGAALAMPPEIAATLVQRLVEWLEHTTHMFLADDHADLVVRLAEGGEVDAALALARALLTLRPSSRGPEVAEDLGLARRLEPEAIADSWQYKRAIERMAPVLTKCAGLPALDMFCGLLEEAAKLMSVRGEDGGVEEVTYGWQTAIEDHEQNGIYDSPKDVLVVAVRDVAEALMPSHPKEVLESVEGHPQVIFKRIGLHLRRKWPEADPEGTNALLSDPEVYRDTALHHEMFHLLRTVFSALAPDAQGAFFESIAQDTALQKVKDVLKSWHGRGPTDEEAAKLARDIEFGRLIPVKDSLVAEWRQRYQELAGEFAVGEHPDFLFYIGGSDRSTREAPTTREQLAAMPLASLVQYLRDYRFSDDPYDTSIEGFGMLLSELVKSDPETYVSAAISFQGVQPGIVRGLLSGVRDLVRGDGGFPVHLWKPLLQLCKWITEQPRDQSLRKGHYADLDPGWGWARKEIADVLEEGFKSGTNAIPYELRELAWSVLLPLTSDPDPQRDDERDEGNPSDLAINTVRGRAFNAVVQYALWLRRRADTEPTPSLNPELGFGAMPEVREVLDGHLDVSVEPSPAIRSVYGQWFPWLFLLDKPWAEAEKERIFPAAPQDRHLFDAAWEAYITFCKPYDSVLPVLREEYALAVERVGTWTDEYHRIAHPDERLVDHLMGFYLGAAVELADPLVRAVFEKATPELRGHAMDFIGRGLLKPGDIFIADGRRERIQAFWHWRLGEAQNSEDPASFKGELQWFGNWFASGKFDDRWSLEQLEKALGIASWAELDHLVVKQLGKLSESFPDRTLRCLSMMIDGDQEGYGIASWTESTQAILRNAIECEDAATRDAGIALVHRLGSLGHLEYRALLPSDNAPGGA